MSQENYIQMLEESLAKKVDILAQLQVKNKEQTAILEDPNAAPDDLDKNMEQKSNLIEQLTKLDVGFEQFYQKVKEELDANREAHRDAIRRMQALITEITDRSTELQAQEHRNRDLARRKFSEIHTQVREARQSQKAVSSYYQNMMKVNYIDPQFMDSKK